MAHVRPPAVAGRFYPSDAAALRAQVATFLADAGPVADEDDLASRGRPKALIAPHAGYVYSGPVAGSAYAALGADRSEVRRVIVLGPAHYVPIPGVAVSTASALATPLGDVPVDEAGVESVMAVAGVGVSDEAHAPEHSLEVHLPFLQMALQPGFRVLPLLVGDAPDELVMSVLETAWRDDDTVAVISTDLSHYLGYEAAARRDARTAEAIEALASDRLGPEDACGFRPLRGLLRVARARGLRCQRLDLRNSGDTAGPLDRVVGYGAFAFE